MLWYGECKVEQVTLEASRVADIYEGIGAAKDVEISQVYSGVLSFRELLTPHLDRISYSRSPLLIVAPSLFPRVG